MFGQDLRFALRTLVKYRGFTAVAVLTLAIALGANTAIFSVVNAVLLRPLPFEAPERLVNVLAVLTIDGGDFPVVSHPNYTDLRKQTKTLEYVAAYGRGRSYLMEGDEPEPLVGLSVSANVFPMLGVKPILGRVFTEAEDRAGGPRVLVISHELWQRRFGGDPAVIGRVVRFGTGGETRTIIGVMPPGFRIPVGEPIRDFYKSFEEAMTDNDRQQRTRVFIELLGKLKPGVTEAEASAELAVIGKRLEKQYPASNTGLSFRVASMHEQIVRDVRPALLLLLAAVAAVLLIGCANVANLLLARATGRSREIAIRAAVGASRGRIVRQLLVESVVLSVVAGALGLLLASWGIDALLAMAPEDIPRLDTVTLDTRVLLFCLGISVLTGIAFGLAPALSASKPNLTETLKEGSRGSTEGRQRKRLRGALVVASVALSLVLLAGAGLLLRSFIHVSGIDPGYDYENSISLNVSARSTAYPENPQIVAFFERLMRELRTIPGVESVTAVDHLPLSTNENFHTFDVIGRPPAAPGHELGAKTLTVTPGFFSALHIPIVRGRDYTPQDDASRPKVLVVNEQFVREFFPNQEPIGQRIHLVGTEDVYEIVGVVADVRWRGVTADVPSSFFFALAQRPRGRMSFVVRAPNAETLAPSLRAVMRRIDPQQPITSIETLESMRGESLSTRRFNVILLGLLSALALVLSATGIFSVMSYTVTQRTSEIGIRMAIGAQANDIFRLIVGHSGRLVGIGVVIGVATALAATRVMSTLLYGVKPTDPVTFAAICAIIAAVALVASYLPARRAANVDPLVAIRHE